MNRLALVPLLSALLALPTQAQLASNGATASFRGSLPPKPVAAFSAEQEDGLAKRLTALTADFQQVKNHPRAADADIFLVDVAAALADAAGTNYQPFVTGFDVAQDVLRLDLPLADAGITTLAQLDGQQGVAVQYDPFANLTLINLGNDANGGEVVTISLVGIADASAVEVQII